MNSLMKYFGIGRTWFDNSPKSLSDLIEDVNRLRQGIKERIHSDNISIEVIDSEIDLLNRDRKHKEIDIDTANTILANLNGGADVQRDETK